MFDRKEMLILANLRNNARESLTRMSRRTSIPVSTIFEKIRHYEGNVIRRYTSLIDFTMLGYSTRATIFVRVNKDFKDKLKDHLLLNKSLNSVYKVNNGYDFMLDGVFRDLKEIELFLDKLESEYGVIEKNVYHIVDELKREDFLSSPEYIKIICN